MCGVPGACLFCRPFQPCEETGPFSRAGDVSLRGGIYRGESHSQTRFSGAVVAATSLAVAQPVITQVSKISTQQYQTIVIIGSGFGTHAPYTGDSDYISLTDETADPDWQAGYAPYNDTVTLIVEKWVDSKIILGGFSGGWGEFNWTLSTGDSEQIEVWNPQTGSGPAQITTTIVAEPTATTLTSSPNPSADGQAVTFTAEVNSSGGAPPDGETVAFVTGKTVLGTGPLSGGSGRLHHFDA